MLCVYTRVPVCICVLAKYLYHLSSTTSLGLSLSIIHYLSIYHLSPSTYFYKSIQHLHLSILYLSVATINYLFYPLPSLPLFLDLQWKPLPVAHPCTLVASAALFMNISGQFAISNSTLNYAGP